MGTRTILEVNTGEQTVTFYQDTESKLCDIVTEGLIDGVIATPVKGVEFVIASVEYVRRMVEHLDEIVKKEEKVAVQDVVSSQIIEMIALQACSIYSYDRGTIWHHIVVKPVFEENWFWDNFNDMVDEAVMNLKGAVEGWITVEYEEEIEGILESHSTSVG